MIRDLGRLLADWLFYPRCDVCGIRTPFLDAHLYVDHGDERLGGRR